MMNYSLEPFQTTDKETLIDIWESSVRATHHFLAEADVLKLKDLVSQLDFVRFNAQLVKDAGVSIGFMAINNQNLDMLFLHPHYFNKGIGTWLLQTAIAAQQVQTVDVNEANTQALQFYKKMGFKVVERRPLDDFGNPYPILLMKLDHLNMIPK